MTQEKSVDSAAVVFKALKALEEKEKNAIREIAKELENMAADHHYNWVYLVQAASHARECAETRKYILENFCSVKISENAE